MRSAKLIAICLVIAGMCFAQTPQTGTAPGLVGTITVDGKLDEACYSPTNVIVNMDPARTDVAPAYLGTINDANDLSGQGYLYWDAQYLYIGIHRIDDLHFANAQGTGSSWADDCVEIWITPDYDDANNDFSVPMYGTKGFQFIISMDDVNKEPIMVFDETNPDGLAKTKTDLSGAGFLYEYSAVSGATYDTEMRIAWASSFLGNIVPAEGTTIGFSMGITDNDQSGYEGAMRWCGPNPHTVPGSWGKIILGPGNSHIINTRYMGKTALANNLKPQGSVYDILGRKIMNNDQAKWNGIRVFMNGQNKPVKAYLVK